MWGEAKGGAWGVQVQEQEGAGCACDSTGARTGVFQFPAKSSFPCTDRSLTLAQPGVEGTRRQLCTGLASLGRGFPPVAAGRTLGIRGVKGQSAGGGCVHTDGGEGRQGALGKPVFTNSVLCSHGFLQFFHSVSHKCKGKLWRVVTRSYSLLPAGP